jgi:hypothetical protein
MSRERVDSLVKIQDEARKLFQKKNQDYGDAFANYGPIGVLVRMGDKISRLQSITNHQITLINTESLRDTLIDLHNYSAMAIMLLDEKQSLHEPFAVPSPIVPSLVVPSPTQLFKRRPNTSPNPDTTCQIENIFRPITIEELDQ